MGTGDYIKKVWDHRASKYKNVSDASWGDIHCIMLEIENIAKYVNDGDSVLDVGCANGFSAITQCELHKLASLTGVDFSENMIEYAKQNQQLSNEKNIMNFMVADTRELPFEDNVFDVVYTTRVLINLPTWEEQMLGITECLRVAKKGGIIIFSEAFWEPFMRLNSIRLTVGLPPLQEQDFNRYLKKKKLESLLRDLEYEYECIDFSSVYYIGSRLLRELVTDYENYSGYSNPINSEFCGIQKKYRGGNLGIQQAYIVSKNT